MSKFEFDHVSLLTGTSELARECERFYCEMLGLKIAVPAGKNPEEDFSLLSDGTSGDRASFEIIGQIYEERERKFFDLHGPGLDHLFFETEVVDRSYESLSAAGVQFQVLPYTFLGTRIACCKDPIGTDIKITQHAPSTKTEAIEAKSKGVNARLNHVGILIDDAEKAQETELFYREHFGMREIMRGDPNQEGMNWVYLEDFTGANPFWLEVVGDVFFEQERAFLDNHGFGMDHLSFTVEDANTSFEVLRDRGVKIEIEPLDYDVVRMFYVRDPAGAMIQLIQMLDQSE